MTSLAEQENRCVALIKAHTSNLIAEIRTARALGLHVEVGVRFDDANIHEPLPNVVPRKPL